MLVNGARLSELIVLPVGDGAAGAAARSRVPLVTARCTLDVSPVLIVLVIVHSCKARREQGTVPGAARLRANANAAEVKPLDRTLYRTYSNITDQYIQGYCIHLLYCTNY